MKLLIALSIGLFAQSTFASDFTGFFTMFIMIPILVFSNAIVAIMYAFKAGRVQKFFAKLLFVPAVILSGPLFIFDTLPFIAKYGSMQGLMLVIIYLGLLALLIYGLRKIITRPIKNL